MFYKISKDSSPIDVFEDLKPCYYEPGSKCVLNCNIDANPQGVVSDRRQTYYHVDGWAEFGIPCQTVILEEITESEYLDLKNELDKSDAIAEIKKHVNDHDYSIADIEDAVLELAEIIGG